MAPERKQITRNRISLSCQTCRRRKVKCSKERPVCASCQKAGEECIYVDNESASKPHPPISDAISRKRHAPETDLDRSPAHGLDTYTMRAMEQKLNQLSALLQDLNQLTPPISNGSSPGENQRRDSLNLIDSLGASVASRADMSGHETGPFQQQSFANDSVMKVLTKLDQLNALLRSNSNPHTTPPIKLDRLTSDLSLDGPGQEQCTIRDPKPGTKFEKERLGTKNEPDHDFTAPSEEESNVLFRSWLWSVYPVFPFISPYLVLEKYEAFKNWYWNDLDRGIPNPNLPFMPFMLVIWYTGHLSLSKKGHETWFPWLQNSRKWSRTMRSKIEQYLNVMRTDTRQSIWTLAASVIYHQLTLNGQGLARANVQNSVNIRAAHAMGLHNEKTIMNHEPVEAESRRRIWCEIVSVDALSALNAGMPPLIDECYNDTREPSEYKDIWLGSTDAIKYEEHLIQDDAQPDPVDDALENHTSSLVSVFYLVLKGRSIATQTLRRILKVNMCAQQISMSELKELRKSIARARKQIEDIINRIPTRGVPEFDFVPQTSYAQADFDHLNSMSSEITKQEIKGFLREEDYLGRTSPTTTQAKTVLSSFHKWARISLSTISDGLECASYAPFLRNAKSRLWAVSRNCALRIAHSFLRKYNSLAEAVDLRRFKWTWPLLFNPMHAAVIVLVDLHERPHSGEASRSRALIDTILSLASFEGGIIDFSTWPHTPLPLREGGDEAWTMLKKLRHKAWHGAGLDPDVLWSEQDQMSVGVGKPLTENDLFIRSLREDIIMSHKERTHRLNARGNSEPKLQEVLTQRLRQVATDQYLHPSQLGPGERVTGSVARDIVDWDAAEIPRVLLLRARHDQEVMPFSPAMELTTEPPAFDTSDTFYENPAHGNNGNEVLHLGDLIRKIKQSRHHGSSSTTQNQERQLPVPEVSKNATWAGGVDCMFRDQQKAMDTALEELADRQSMASTVSMKEGLVATSRCVEHRSLSKSPIATDAIPNFVYFPRAPVSAAEVKQSSMPQQGHGHIPSEPSQASITTAEQSDDTFWINSSRIDNSFIDNRTEPDNNIATDTVAMELGFDWNRWDEMFSQNPLGFEDMMMDLASELQQE